MRHAYAVSGRGTGFRKKCIEGFRLKHDIAQTDVDKIQDFAASHDFDVIEGIHTAVQEVFDVTECTDIAFVAF